MAVGFSRGERKRFSKAWMEMTAARHRGQGICDIEIFDEDVKRNL
eukprot:gene14393-21658_t